MVDLRRPAPSNEVPSGAARCDGRREPSTHANFDDRLGGRTSGSASCGHAAALALGSSVPQAVIAQMRCPSLRFEPRAKKSCRPLLEQFRPRVRNEAIAVWHLHARKRLRVENHCFVDNIAFRKDESYHRINLIGV